jgi:hypothetical protein
MVTTFQWENRMKVTTWGRDGHSAGQENPSPLTGSRILLPYLQQPAIGRYPEPVESSPQSQTFYKPILLIIQSFPGLLRGLLSLAICCYALNYNGRTTQTNGQHSCFVFRRFRVQIPARRPVILTETFRDIPQSLQVNAGIELGHDSFLPYPSQFIVH